MECGGSPAASPLRRERATGVGAFLQRNVKVRQRAVGEQRRKGVHGKVHAARMKLLVAESDRRRAVVERRDRGGELRRKRERRADNADQEGALDEGGHGPGGAPPRVRATW